MLKKNPYAQKVQTASIPAPVGGLNARDALANMPETDAVILDNWFPTPTDIAVRNGSSFFALTDGGVSGNTVETLMAYNGVATKNLFAIDSEGIADITSGGFSNPADVTGLSNARFQYVNFSTSGGHYLLAVNGLDPEQAFDGTVWSVPSITGVSSSNLIGINIFKNRVWYTEKNSTKAWYLPVNSIAGAAVAFDVGPLFRLGGYLMGTVTWTLNTQNGTDEVLVFVSSEGECVVYQGYDPSSAATFAQAGHFRIGRPIGRRFFCKAGADIIMITADGAIPLSQAMLTDRSQLRIALSDKIVNLITSDVQSYSDNFGWQVILYPIGNKLIVNVPQTEISRNYQYVMNGITGAWCTFGKQNSNSSWNACCFEIFNDDLYFGGSFTSPVFGTVFKADTGTTDGPFNASIYSYAKPAYSYFKSRGQQKYFTMARPIMQLNGTIQVAVAMNVDFEDTIPNVNYATVSTSGGSLWDVSPWDVSPWGSTNSIVKDWQTTNGIGYAGSLSITAVTNIELSWQSTDYVFQLGGIL